MADLFPSGIRPAEVVWHLKSKTQKHESPLSAVATTYEMARAAKWMASLTFTDWRRYELAELEAFIASMRGSAGRFLLWHHARETPRGTADGVPAVAGAAQTGNTLNTNGWTPNALGVLLRSDYMGVNGELKIITSAQVDADAGGAASITFEPPLRNSPADGALITLNKPTATFMLIGDTEGAIKHAKATGSLTLQCEEALV